MPRLCFVSFLLGVATVVFRRHLGELMHACHKEAGPAVVSADGYAFLAAILGGAAIAVSAGFLLVNWLGR